MAQPDRSTSAAELAITNANEDFTSSTALPVAPLPSEGSAHYPSRRVPPVLPYTQQDLGVVCCGSMTPPPPYADSDSDLAHGDSSQPCAHESVYPSMPHCLKASKSDDGSWLLIGPTEAPRSNQSQVDSQDDRSHVQELTRSRCSTMWTQRSRALNYHVNPDNDIYRWQTTEIPIPVGIDLSSFESSEQRRMTKTCLITVLDKFNASNVGPNFRYVVKPSHSAFFIRFGGDHPFYAHSFFPGSPPKDWYIDVFRPGLTLSEDQEQFLMTTTSEDISIARKKALKHNLINILTHEMLHVVGVRHCDAQLTEMERCVRFPPGLSDDENNEEHLMQRSLDWRSLCQLQWLSRTIQEIQQIYAMKVGERIGYHRIRDVSWQVGAKQRKEIALRNARCCVT